MAEATWTATHSTPALIVGVLLTVIAQLLNPKVMTTLALCVGMFCGKDGKQLLELAEIHELGDASRNRRTRQPRRGRHRCEGAGQTAGETGGRSHGQ